MSPGYPVARIGLVALLAAALSIAARAEDVAPEEGREEAIERHSTKGLKAWRSGNHDEVLARMERLAKVDPTNPLAPYLVGRVQARIGEYEKALETLSAGATAHPGHVGILSARLGILLDLGRVEAAQTAAQAVLAGRPADPVARTALGIALEARGRRDDALVEFRRVVADARGSTPAPEAVPWVAQAALRVTRLSPDLDEDRIQEGAALLAAQVQADAGDQDALLAYANLWQEDRGAKSQATASKYYRQLLDANAEVAEARVGMARYFLIFWQQDKAVDSLRRALRTNPRLVPALSLLAAIHVGNGDYDEADRLLARALQVAPRDREARSVKAARLWIAGKRAEFDALAAEVLADDPRYGRLYAIASELVGERQRRYDTAADLARKAIEIDPTDAATFVTLGENLMNLGLTDEAEVQFRAAWEKSKRHEDLKRDNWRESLRAIKTFVTAKSEHFVVRMHLSEAAVMERYLLPLLEESWTTLSAKYGFTPSSPILVDSFHRPDDFSVRSVGVLGLPALGVCFGRVITLLGPFAQPVGAFSWSRTTWHEFAHVVTLQQSRGQVPRWLTEGLSVYEEKSRRPLWGRDMQRVLFDRLMNGRLLKMSAINSAFRGPDILFAYYQGGLIAEHLEKERGFAVIPRMLERFAEDRTTEEVFREVLSIELADYDRRFEEFVREMVGGYRLVPRWDEASLEAFRARTKKDETDAEAWTNLAWALFQRGKSIDAGAAMGRAIALTPVAPSLELLQGRMAEVAKRPDLAESHFRRFLETGGDDLEARMFLAGRELQRGADTAKAIAHLEAAKRCFPFHNGKDSPYLQLAGLFEATDPARALAEYEAFARVAAENYQVRSEKLKPAYLRREDWENLSRVCEEMVDISPFGANRDDPPDLALHRDWATALLALGRREEALRELEVQTLLVDRLPEEDRVGAGAVTDHLRLGRLLLEMGLADRALEEAMAALRLSPDDAEAIMLRTRAREAGGDR